MAWKIVSKTVNGNQYFYAKNTGKRLPNKPVEEKYLGSADDIVAIIDAFHNPPTPEPKIGSLALSLPYGRWSNG